MVILSKLLRALTDIIWQASQGEKNDGTHKSTCSNDIHNLVLHVHPLLAHGSEGRIRLENGPAAVIPRTAPFHALLFCVQKVAKRTISISTEHLSGR
jgi:hypothetical protein